MLPNLTLDTIISRQDHLKVAELNPNELVMLSVKRNSYYGLEESAKAIWDCLDQPHSVAAIVNHLRTLFDVDAETCQRETLAFLVELLNNELVRVEHGGE